MKGEAKRKDPVILAGLVRKDPVGVSRVGQEGSGYLSRVGQEGSGTAMSDSAQGPSNVSKFTGPAVLLPEAQRTARSSHGFSGSRGPRR